MNLLTTFLTMFVWFAVSLPAYAQQRTEQQVPAPVPPPPPLPQLPGVEPVPTLPSLEAGNVKLPAVTPEPIFDAPKPAENTSPSPEAPQAPTEPNIKDEAQNAAKPPALPPLPDTSNVKIPTIPDAADRNIPGLETLPKADIKAEDVKIPPLPPLEKAQEKLPDNLLDSKKAEKAIDDLLKKSGRSGQSQAKQSKPSKSATAKTNQAKAEDKAKDGFSAVEDIEGVIKDPNDRTRVIAPTDFDYSTAKKAQAEQVVKPSAKVMAGLFAVAARNDFSAFRAYMEQGISPNVTNNGESILCHAILHSSSKIAVYLVKKGADVNKQCLSSSYPLLGALESGDLEVSKAIQATKKARMDITDTLGNTPLILAAKMQSEKEAMNFIPRTKSALAERYINASDTSGKTALHYAAAYGLKQLTEILTRAGANINTQDKNGSTPLMLAAYSSRSEVVAYLVKIGADKSLKDKYGRDASAIAALNGNPEIPILLSNICK